MKIDSLRMVYFSPTNTTKSILEHIARGIEPDSASPLDLTLPSAETGEAAVILESAALIGAPVYGGRLPVEAAARLRRLQGKNTPAVVVVVYGNRAYEDALLELADLAAERGFVPVAAGAFIGEHSFSTAAVPIAHGRPDERDRQRAFSFGVMIGDRLRSLRPEQELPLIHVPGNRPYKQWKKGAGASSAAGEACSGCGTCVRFCPAGAIVISGRAVTDPERCILCCACVRHCPTGARLMADPGVRASADWLSENCARRKEPEVWL